MKKNIVLYLLFAFSFNSMAQQIPDTGETKLGTWLEVTSANRLSQKFNLSASYTNWDYDGFKNYQLHLGLIGISYVFNSKTSAGIGYGYGNIETIFENAGLPAIDENRIFEFVTINHNTKKVSWSHRFKLEQRFFKRPTENVLIHRVRYRIKGTLPLNKSFFISVYDEIHFNLNPFDFQQNRAFAGIGYKVYKNNNLILGYARHSFKSKSFNRLSLQLNLKFDFRKSE